MGSAYNPTMIKAIASWVWIVSGVLLIISVLLHSPKGDGMGGLVSSGGSMFTSARSAENTLNRVTWTLLSVFLGLAVVLSAGWLG
jgi:preprotein translocase subunit SecG